MSGQSSSRSHIFWDTLYMIQWKTDYCAWKQFVKHVEACGRVPPDNYHNNIDICHLNFEIAKRSRFGDAYIQAHGEEGPAADEGESAKVIMFHSRRTQVACVSANMNHLQVMPRKTKAFRSRLPKATRWYSW